MKVTGVARTGKAKEGKPVARDVCAPVVGKIDGPLGDARVRRVGCLLAQRLAPCEQRHGQVLGTPSLEDSIDGGALPVRLRVLDEDALQVVGAGECEMDAPADRWFLSGGAANGHAERRHLVNAADGASGVGEGGKWVIAQRHLDDEVDGDVLRRGE